LGFDLSPMGFVFELCSSDSRICASVLEVRVLKISQDLRAGI